MGRGNFWGFLAEWKALRVSAVVYAAKGIIPFSMTSWPYKKVSVYFKLAVIRLNSSIIKQCSNRTQDIKTLRHLLTVCNIRSNTAAADYNAPAWSMAYYIVSVKNAPHCDAASFTEFIHCVLLYIRAPFSCTIHCFDTVG